MVAIHNLGLQDYESTWQAMQQFTQNRDAETEDEIWITEHPPVYTLGLNGNPEHLLNTGDIPVINSDRGGQVTYHGPGQLVIYTLIDIKRLNLGVRQL
ncbi:MAG: lipoyl(octanoyl) transferase LipB, partial [Methylobacter sp.]